MRTNRLLSYVNARATTLRFFSFLAISPSLIKIIRLNLLSIVFNDSMRIPRYRLGCNRLSPVPLLLYAACKGGLNCLRLLPYYPLSPKPISVSSAECAAAAFMSTPYYQPYGICRLFVKSCFNFAPAVNAVCRRIRLIIFQRAVLFRRP